MEQFNIYLYKLLGIKDVNIKITWIPDCYWLFIDKLEPEFDEELQKVISDNDVPEADEEQLKEEPTNTTKMFDSYIDMEIARHLRGLYGELYHAKVKRCAVHRDGITVGVQFLTQSLIQDYMT